MKRRGEEKKKERKSEMGREEERRLFSLVCVAPLIPPVITVL